MAEEKIRSESEFLWKLILKFILTPFYFVMFLFGKKSFSEVFSPFIDLLKFLFEPKFTIGIIILTTITTFYSWIFLTEKTFNLLMNYPLDLFNPSRYFSFITTGFIHADLAHLGWNMLTLYIFGRVVERKIGTFKTSVIYFSALIIASIGTSAANAFIGDNIPGLGASGAIMGLVSAAILLDPFFITYEAIIPLPIMVVGWFAIYGDLTGVLSRIDDGIGHFAHLFGFLSVSLTLYFFNQGDKNSIKKGFWINICSIIVIISVYLFLVRN